ncbi:MAG TPA: hypothetical protein VLR94_11700, partial [Acidobacteriota bacterium]|nr:hypothetical protein [Acidobacteriota bacterium]
RFEELSYSWARISSTSCYYYRGDKVGRSIGLVISRHFTHMMGGDIVAQSEYGKGTPSPSGSLQA